MEFSIGEKLQIHYRSERVRKRGERMGWGWSEADDLGVGPKFQAGLFCRGRYAQNGSPLDRRRMCATGRLFFAGVQEISFWEEGAEK